MTLEIGTPALLFPAVSLLFLAYTNRFLHLAALIRQLHRDWIDRPEEHLKLQIDNLRTRLLLIRWMQLLGAVGLLLCVLAMLAVAAQSNGLAWIFFVGALLFLAASLGALIVEIAFSGGALRIMLEEVEKGCE